MKILYFDCSNGISGDMLLQSMAYAGDRIMDMETAAAVTEAMELTGMIIMTTGITDMAGAMTR